MGTLGLAQERRSGAHIVKNQMPLRRDLFAQPAIINGAHREDLFGRQWAEFCAAPEVVLAMVLRQARKESLHENLVRLQRKDRSASTLMLGAATPLFGPFAFRLQLQHLLKPVIRGLNRRRVVWMPCQPAAGGGLEGPQTSPQGPICPHLAMKRRPMIVPKGNQVASGARSSAIRRPATAPRTDSDTNKVWEVSAKGLAKPLQNSARNRTC